MCIRDRFPRSPVQQLEFTEEQLKGFEYYLSYAYFKINNYTEEDATSNYAADKKKDAWLCKIGKWRCPYIDAYDYYSLKDKDGNQISSSFKKEELESVKEKSQKIVKEKYEGCPRHAGSDEYLDIFS